MDTIVLRTVSFVSRTIRLQRAGAGFAGGERHERAVSATPVAPHPGQEPLAPVVAPPSSMVDGSGTAMEGCSVTDNLPYFAWQDATMILEDTGKARSGRGIMPNVTWEQIALLLGSVGSDIRRV
jgi:hypothetical protein